MKVLQINAVYGVGSTGHIVQDIHEALLKEKHQSYIFWGISNTEDKSNKNFIRIGNVLDHKLHALLRRILDNQGWNSRIATWIACKRIEAIKPDVVHLHNLHSNYINLTILLKFLSKENTAVLVTLHDCWFYTGYCNHYHNYKNCKQWQSGCQECPAVKQKARKRIAKVYLEKEKLFSNIKRLAVNGVSKWTLQDVDDSILHSARIKTYIYNWIDTSIFYPRNSRKKVHEKYDIPLNQKIILGVSQGWSEGKGLREFVELGKRCQGKATVILVGHCDLQPNDKDNLKPLGFIRDRNELADLYSAADVYVNPSRMETFGLVTAEAMACGTPVVAYNNTGSKEIVTQQCGMLVEDGNVEQLCNGVTKILNEDKEKYYEACLDNVALRFSKEGNIKKYVDLYMRLIKA